MGWRRLTSLTLGLLALAGCRTSDPAQRPEGALLTNPKPVRSELFIQEVTTPPQEVKGFDLAGATTCMPLAEGRTCLTRKDEVAEACTKSQGSTKRCEDCKVVCDKPVAR